MSTNIIIDNYRGWDIAVNGSGHLIATYPDEPAVHCRNADNHQMLAAIKETIDARLEDQQKKKQKAAAQAAAQAAEQAAEQAAIKARGPKPKAVRGYPDPDNGKCVYYNGHQVRIKSLRRRDVESWLVDPYSISIKFEEVVSGVSYTEDMRNNSTVVMTTDEYAEWVRVRDEQAEASRTVSKLYKQYVVRVTSRMRDGEIIVATEPDEESGRLTPRTIKVPFTVAATDTSLEWAVPGTTVRHVGDVSGFLRKVGNAALQQSNFEAINKWSHRLYLSESRCNAVLKDGRDKVLAAQEQYNLLYEESKKLRDAGHAAYNEYVEGLCAVREEYRKALAAWEAS